MQRLKRAQVTLKDSTTTKIHGIGHKPTSIILVVEQMMIHSHYPALLAAFSLLLGTFFALYRDLFITIPLTLLLALAKPKQKLLYLIIFLIPLCFTKQGVQEGKKKVAYFETTSITPKQTFYGSYLLYKGILYDEQGIEEVLIQSKPSHHSIKGNYLYKVTGELIKKKDAIFKLDGPPQPAGKNWGFAEERFHLKQQFKAYLKNKMKSKESSSFLSAIFTGELDSLDLAFSLNRVGLSHLLAISGFHFAILALILSLPLKLLPSIKWQIFFIVILLTLYFLFIGYTPSIARAYLSFAIGSTLLLFQRESSALNRLGCTLIVLLAVEINQVKSLSFIFSFAATLGILLFFNPIKEILNFFIPDKCFKIALKESILNKIGIILLDFLKDSFAIMMAVNVVALPLTLYFFHQFPYLSLLYNLFIPIFLFLSMSLLLVGLFFDLMLSSIGAWIHDFNSTYTDLYLRMITHIPASFHRSYLNNSLEASDLTLFFTLVIFFGLLLQEYQLKRSDFIEKFV